VTNHETGHGQRIACGKPCGTDWRGRRLDHLRFHGSGYQRKRILLGESYRHRGHRYLQRQLRKCNAHVLVRHGLFRLWRLEYRQQRG